MADVVAGTYDITFSAVGYTSATASLTVVGKSDSYLTVDRFKDLNITNKDSVVLNATLVDLDTKNPIEGATIVFLVNNIEYENTTDANGIAHYTLKDLEKGEYLVNYKFDGNDTYTSDSILLNDNIIVKNYTEIDVNESLDLKVDANASLNAKLTPADVGTLNYTSSNDSVVTVDKDGNIKAIGEGSAVVTVSFDGNDDYAAAENKTVTVTVIKNDIAINVTDSLNLNVDEECTIEVKLNETDAKGNITFDSSDVSVVTVDKDGNVKAVGAGNANITVSYAGDNKYYENSTTITVTVSKMRTEINIENTTITLNALD